MRPPIYPGKRISMDTRALGFKNKTDKKSLHCLNYDVRFLGDNIHFGKPSGYLLEIAEYAFSSNLAFENSEPDDTLHHFLAASVLYSINRKFAHRSS